MVGWMQAKGWLVGWLVRSHKTGFVRSHKMSHKTGHKKVCDMYFSYIP